MTVLAGSLSDDPVFPKAPWPSPALCHSCHQEKDGVHTWNQEQVLVFLRQHYGAANLSPRYLPEPQQHLPTPPPALPQTPQDPQGGVKALQQQQQQPTSRATAVVVGGGGSPGPHSAPFWSRRVDPRVHQCGHEPVSGSLRLLLPDAHAALLLLQDPLKTLEAPAQPASCVTRPALTQVYLSPEWTSFVFCFFCWDKKIGFFL